LNFSDAMAVAILKKPSPQRCQDDSSSVAGLIGPGGRRVAQVTKVFIASRFSAEGLDKIRESIVAEVNSRAGLLQAVQLDDGRADHRSPTTRSLETVHECDVLVLLLGNTHSESHVGSITEMEFDAATDAGLIVLAYELPASELRHPEATRFIARVREQEPRTIGTITGEVGDAARIVSDVFAAIQRAESEDPFDETTSHGIYGGLLRAARYLDFDAEVKGNPPAGDTAHVRIIEERTFAFKALKLGDPSIALDHFRRALTVFELDWISAYCAAWLRWSSSSRGDRSRAADYADAAVRAAQSSAATDRQADRRLVASLLVRAQLARQSGDLALSADRLDKALAIHSYSKPVMSERLRVAAALNEVKKARQVGVELFRRYPTHMREILPSTDLQPVRSEVERAICSELSALAATLNGATPSTRQPIGVLVNVVRAAYRDRRHQSLVAVHLVKGNVETLARRLDLAAPSEGRFATTEDVNARIELCEAEQKLIASDLDELRAKIYNDPEAASRPRIQLGQLLTDLGRDKSGVEDQQRTTSASLAIAQHRLKGLRPKLKILLGVAAVMLATLLGLWALKGHYLRLELAIAAVLIAGFGPPVSTFAADSIVRSKTAKANELERRSNELAAQRTRLLHLIASTDDGLALEEQLRRLTDRCVDLEAVMENSVHMTKEAVRAQLVAELSQASSTVARWAAVLEPSRYRPRYRARAGHATRFSPAERAGGLLADAPTLRIALAIAREGDGLRASDLMILLDDTSPSAAEPLLKFEDWLSAPWHSSIAMPALRSFEAAGNVNIEWLPPEAPPTMQEIESEVDLW
jgi:hypothetical protein